MKIHAFNNYDLEGSFVYFIFSKELLYIGETQKITFSRWVQHFYKSGSFSVNVRKHGDDNTNYFIDVNLLSVELVKIRKEFPEIRWKLMTQAVEHALHEILHATKSRLIETYYKRYEPDVDFFIIISDTSKTAPRGIAQKDWIFARTYAAEVMDGVYNHL